MPRSSITIRSFEWSDVSALAKLQDKSEADVGRWLGQPNLRPERDCLLAFEDGKAIDYGYVVVEPTIKRGVLQASSNDPDAAAALLEAATALARNLDLDVLHIDLADDDLERQEMCKAAGMIHVRTHLHMVRPGTQKTGIGMPPEVTVRMATRADAGIVTDLQNAAFTGSWGYSPNTPEEIAYRIFVAPNNPPDPVVLLEVDGEVRGFCWSHRETPDSPGMVGMVGVWPEQQNRGYGKLATAAGIDHLVAIGATPVIITVDSANPPAIHVYESLGFELDWRSVWYEAALR